MKMVTPALAGALASLYANNASLVQRDFILTPSGLEEFEQTLSTTCSLEPSEEDLHTAVAHACLRRKAYQALAKFSHMATPREVEEALYQTKLPTQVQEKLLQRNDRPEAPTTWKEELDYLQTLSKNHDNPKEWIWQQLLNHPMTEYVPVQCPKCGQVLPDSYSPGTSQAEADAQVGLLEMEPSGEELSLRSGWFRGPRGPVIFQIACTNTNCSQQTYQWHRSGHPQLLLALNRGRLCGEQEDLRLSLANYLDISVRMALPLDWDHVWTEFQTGGVDLQSTSKTWHVEDDSARNFACRLDEGIGSWTGVLALHPDPALCEEVTADYLKSQREGGRVDNQHCDKLKEFSKRVQEARTDGSFKSTQAGSGAGFVINRAGLTCAQVTGILQEAASDYKRGVPWWKLIENQSPQGSQRAN